MEKKANNLVLGEGKDDILDLNFVPQWARKPPGENHYTHYHTTERKGGSRRSPNRENRDSHSRGNVRSPRRGERGGERSRRPPPSRDPVREIPVEVSFLPEQQRLASLVRQIHHTRRAYPLMDLANLFIHDSEGYLVKLEVHREAPDMSLYQCKKCKATACSKEMIEQHLLAKHLEDLYEKKEIEAEPPSGQFVCVARCRKSGVLLGPPNHHSYAEKLNKLHQSRFSHLPFEEYKQHIETLRDETLIEQWKEETRKQTVYTLKSDPEAPSLDRAKAEVEFKKSISSMYEITRRAVMPSTVAQKLEDRDITNAIRRAWSKESRFPLSTSFAMRAAFRHMHLHLFKAGKINFVTHIKPRPVKPEKTIENIAEVLRFLEAHPGSTRRDLLEALHPSIDPSSKEAHKALQPLGWLIERGHIIEFFNGTLSVPIGLRHR